MAKKPIRGRHPFGMNPPDMRVFRSMQVVRNIQKRCPETICNHRNECCKAGCPNMYYSEFLNLRHGYVDKLTRDERIELTLGCVKRYLMPQKPGVTKPCVFLGEDTMCKCYDFRPVKCRIYGLIPKKVYRQIVKSVAKDMNMAADDLPLCHQCPHVKMKEEHLKDYPDGKLPERVIKNIEEDMRHNDRKMLGMPRRMQEQGFGFLTYHDWHMMFELGPSQMEVYSKLRLKLNDEEKEDFMVKLKNALEEAESKEDQEEEPSKEDDDDKTT